jgi:thiol-disulfide isomerase/thioredoxin
MRTTRTLTILALVLVTGTFALAQGSTEDRIQQLERRVSELEALLDQRIAELESRMTTKIDAEIKAFAEREENAVAALREINALATRGQQVEAKSKMDQFLKDYRGTDAVKQAGRLQQELAVVGKAAPGQLNVEKWFQGEGEVAELAGDGTKLLVFWEVWCPHCKREVPKLQATYDKFKDKGLEVLGLTKITKSATEESVSDFISANSVSYPMAKESGDLSRYFNVSGIPAAAVVKDGKVIWRGHPARLTDKMLEDWL